tara:strand:- start:131 stop:307 length:177 start_codon:yes stop_codon:yes gene_type:complete
MDVRYFYQLKGVRAGIFLKIKKESGKFDSALNHGHILRFQTSRFVENTLYCVKSINTA